SQAEIDLLRTFADQAVIAIENVRLFNETKEALEQQTATADILRVISSSPTDLQPVFNAIVQNAVRLCDGDSATAYRFDGKYQHLAALSNVTSTTESYLRSRFPGEPERSSVTGLAILERVVVHVPDVASDPRFPRTREPIAATSEIGTRAVLAVPMLQNGKSVGAIFVSRRGERARSFSTGQIELLKTFADQAVIAIENVRLFTELQEKNHALTQSHAQVSEALEQQTSTAEILRVISRSPTDLRPVFDTIVSSAVRLCRAHIGVVYQFDGERLHLVAHHDLTLEMLDALGRLYPKPPQRDTVSGRAILSRAVVQIEDVLADDEFHQDLARSTGWRSMVAVPMLRESLPIGAIVINRS